MAATGAMADILRLRSLSSSSQCRPPAFSLNPVPFPRHLVTVARGFRIGRLRASQHLGGGSVERNDAAVTGPSVKPEPKFAAEEAVEAQMNALADNDYPRADHGLEVMYNFADSEGALNGGTLPEYFGFPSDLYHFGHFALKFKSRYPELLSHSGYEIVSIYRDDEDHCKIRLKLKEDVDSEWVFSLSKISRGQFSEFATKLIMPPFNESLESFIKYDMSFKIPSTNLERASL